MTKNQKGNDLKIQRTNRRPFIVMIREIVPHYEYLDNGLMIDRNRDS